MPPPNSAPHAPIHPRLDFGAMAAKKVIGLEEGLAFLSEAFARASRILDGNPELKFTTDEYMSFYECSYRMCTQVPDYTRNLYEWYKVSLDQCIKAKVLPSLMDKNGETLLQELLKIWSYYQSMTRWLSVSFQYMDRYYIYRQNLPSLNEVAVNSFCCQVFSALNDKIRDVVIYMIVRECEGKQVNIQLLKDTVSFIQSSNDEIKNFYQKEFEQAMFQYTCAFYSQKASEWVSEYSLSDYLLQIEECLKRENERLSQYFINDYNRRKLVGVIKDQLTSVCQSQLKSLGINDPNSLRRYLETNQELGLRCANLSLNDGNMGAVPCMSMDS